MLWKRRMFWNVRATPSGVIWCGDSPVISRPLKAIVPWVGL